MQSPHRHPKTRINDPPMQCVSIIPAIQKRKQEMPISKGISIDDKNNVFTSQAKIAQNPTIKLTSQRSTKLQGSSTKAQTENFLKLSEMKPNLLNMTPNLSKTKEIPTSKTISSNNKIVDSPNFKKTVVDDKQSPAQTEYCTNCNFLLQVLKHYNKKSRTSKSLDKNGTENETEIKPIPHASPNKIAKTSTAKLEQKKTVSLPKRTQSAFDEKDAEQANPKGKSSSSRKNDIVGEAKQTEVNVKRESNQKKLDLQQNQGFGENISLPEKHHQLLKTDYLIQQSPFKEESIYPKILTDPQSEVEQEQVNCSCEFYSKDVLLKDMESKIRRLILELTHTKEKLDLLTKEKLNCISNQTAQKENLQAELRRTAELLNEKEQAISTLKSENIASQTKYEEALTNHQMVMAQFSTQYIEKIKELEIQL